MDAFRDGLMVSLNEETVATLRQCCTVADIQQLLCGAATIDLDDWQANTEVEGFGEMTEIVAGSCLQWQAAWK
eukprot:COSAG03_NODE_1179_length_4634_cov_2.694004_4_plen_73_part_00